MLFTYHMRVIAAFLMLWLSVWCQQDAHPDFWMNSGREELSRAKSLQHVLRVAKNVLVFVGDGMGVSTVTAARILKGQLQNKTGEETRLSFEDFPSVGLIKTYAVDGQVSDSASTATAILSGVKAKLWTVGVDGRVDNGDCNASHFYKVDTALDWALAAGKSVGLVTTTRVTHATPAAAYAYAADRGWEGDVEMAGVDHCTDIAAQLVRDNPNIQVVLGGGRRYFMSNQTLDPETNSNYKHRQDGADLIQEWLAEKSSRGVTHKFVWNASDFYSVDAQSTDYLLGLFQDSHMKYELDRQQGQTALEAGEPSLAEMTEKAIQILQKNSRGFFLLVEGGRIDHGHHGNQAVQALHDTLAFEEAVATATEMVATEETLVVVTADHSHVLSMAGYPARGNPIFGVAGTGDDKLPYTTLAYGNGPGFAFSPSGTRANITGVDTASPSYRSQAAVPLYSETHGGEDVAVYASGPFSHFLHGVHEQSYIAHVIGFSACLGPYSASADCASSLLPNPPQPCAHAAAAQITWSAGMSLIGYLAIKIV